MPKRFIKYYSLNSNPIINPWYITGFADGEACFNILITKSSTNLIGWQVQVRFIIEVNIKDLDNVYNIQKFFGSIGSIIIINKVARLFKVLAILLI